MLPGTGIQERPPSPLSYEEQVAAQQQKRLDGDMGRYIGIGEGPIMPGPVDYDEPETGFKSTLMPPQQTINTSAGPMLPPTPMPNPPVSLPRPTTMPMPGDIGYVPYGSRNNQLVPPGYEKPSFVQGLAGGGPIRNLSFVELLKQIMEN